MSKLYECLECRAIGNIANLELETNDNDLFGRIICSKCGSIKLCKIYSKSNNKFIINGDLVAPYLDSRILAMSEEERKLEEIFMISDGLSINLIDIYIEINNLINGLNLLDNHNYSFVNTSIKMLEKNNEKLFSLTEKIRLINKLTQ